MTEAQSCHLAMVPNHAVVSRKDKADFVRRMLFNQQVWAHRRSFHTVTLTEHSGHLQNLQAHPAQSHTLSPWAVELNSHSSASDESRKLARGDAHFVLWGCLGYQS